jgi:hypothetical protein
MAKKSDERFSPDETQQRFDAALRGARITGHKPMKDIPARRKVSGKKLRKKRS